MQDNYINVYTNLTYNDLLQWLRTAKPNSQFLYYEGFLANDCQYTDKNELIKLAKSVMKLYDKRVITLVQQKISTGNYKYIAIKI